MGKFGDKLRRERELRGVTLDEIAEATKIGTRSLRALEEEKFDQLPGGIFNKGFVRSYARFLGLDEEQAVADYIASQADQPSKSDVLEKMAAQAEAARVNEAAAMGDKSGSSKMWVAVAVLVLVAIGAGGGWKYYQKYTQQKAQAAQTSQDAPPPQIQTAPPAPASLTPTDVAATMQSPTGSSAAETPAATTPAATNPLTTSSSTVAKPTNTSTTSAQPAPATVGKPADGSKNALELQIHVGRATWLSVQADGKEPTTETLRDSATKTVVAQDRVVLTTGNSVDVTCNGKSLGVLGEDNKRSQLRITSDCKVN